MKATGDPFVLEAFALGAPAEVYLNGIPVTRTRPPPGNPRFGATINPLVRDGRNTLEVVVDPGERPALARVAANLHSDAGIRVRARLLRSAHGGVIGEALPSEVLCKVDFEGDGLARSFPHLLSREVTIASPFPRWRWERAEPLREGPRLTDEVMNFVADYRLALSRRDLVRHNAMSALLHEEMCAAFGSDPARRLETINRFLRDLWGRADWAMEPIDADDLDIRLCADGRLVQCLTRTWDDPIRSNADAGGGRLSVSMFLGRIDGRLQWLR